MKESCRMSSKFVAVFLAVTLCVLSVGFATYAEEEENINSEVYAVDNSASENLGVSLVKDGSVYALFNVGSELWASTATNAATINSHNLFQCSAWGSTAQNFRFVKSNRPGVDNVYIIYPLEYNNNNADEVRALSCDYSQIENNNASRVNVLPAVISYSNIENFEWLIKQESDGSYSICLYADQRYILSAVGSAAGSVTTTGVNETGNICVRKTSTEPSNIQKWFFKYMIPNGQYVFHNKGNNQYLQTGAYGIPIQTQPLSSLEGIVWTVQHIQNGIYFVSTSSGLNLRVASANPNEGDTVYLDYNMAQTTFQWRIEQLPNKSYKITNIHTENTGNDYVLKGQYSTLPVNVCIGAYSDDTNYSDEWYIYEATADVYAHFYLGKYYGDTNLLGSLNTVRSLCSTEGKMLGWGYNTTTRATYLEMLDTVDFFTHITTGNSDYINVHSYPSLLDYTVHIDDYFEPGELSNIKFAMIGSCYSGSLNQNNPCLAKSIKDKGAQIVLGFHNSVDEYALGTWSTVFLKILLSGETVNYSVDQADRALDGTGMIGNDDLSSITASVRVYGDGNTAPFE